MKKTGRRALLFVFALFLGFVSGYFLARSTQEPVVVIQRYDAPPTLAATETVSETPAQTSPATQPSAPSAQTDPLEPVDLNAATKEQLIALPGIGEKPAQKILDYRDSNGGFQDVFELMEVNGIGEKKMEALLPYLVVGGTVSEDSGS